MEKEFYPKLDEVYSPEWIFIKADDTVPTYQKREFRRLVKDIQRNLAAVDFTETEIEDYLKTLIEDIVD